MQATRYFGAVILAGALAAACSRGPERAHEVTDSVDGSSMNKVAEQYVRLTLAIGEHDPDYVDAYYGPPEWRAAAILRAGIQRRPGIEPARPGAGIQLPDGPDSGERHQRNERRRDGRGGAGRRPAAAG